MRPEMIDRIPVSSHTASATRAIRSAIHGDVENNGAYDGRS